MKNGDTISITNIQIQNLEELVKVYNFEVEGFHTYYVGSERLLVHNTCSGNTRVWNKGSFSTSEKSMAQHFKKHGVEVGAENIDQYVRKAEEFARTAKKGSLKSPVKGDVEGVIRYKKNGKYIDLAPDGSIISFGTQ